MADGTRSDVVDQDAPIPKVTGEDAPVQEIKLTKRERDRIAEMVVEDVKHAESVRTGWLDKRRKAIKRFEMEREQKNWPWPNASNVKLPTVATTVFATQARLMASIFGVSQITQVTAVGSDDMDRVPAAQQFAEFLVTDKRINFYKLIDEVSEPVCTRGDYVIHIPWDKEIRRFPERREFFEDPFNPGRPLIDTETGERVEFSDLQTAMKVLLPIIVRQLMEKAQAQAQIQQVQAQGEQGQQQSPNREQIIQSAKEQVQQFIQSERAEKIEVIETRDVTVFEGARPVAFDTEDLILPSDATGVQSNESDWCCQRVWMSLDEIARKRKSGAFNVLTSQDFTLIRSNEEGGDGAKQGEVKDEQDNSVGVLSSPGRNKRQVLNWHGKFDVDKDGLAEEVIFTVHKDTTVLMRAVYLDDVVPHGRRPFVIIPFIRQAGDPHGKGIAELVGDLDDAINTLLNMVMDRGSLLNSMTGFYESDSGQDKPIKVKIGQMIPIENLKGIVFPNLPEYTNLLTLIISILQGEIEKLTGINDTSAGRINTSSRATATEISGVLGEGNIGFELKNRRFQDGVSEVLTQMFQLYQAFMPEGFEMKVNPKAANKPGETAFKRVSREDIRGQFDFRFLGDPVSGNKQLRLQKILLLAQTIIPVLANVFPAGVVQVIRAVLNEFDRKDVDEMLPPEVFQLLVQQQQSAQQAEQLQSELAQANFQLEQQKGQAEVAQIQAIIQDIQSRIQERIAKIQQMGVQARKLISEAEAVDVGAFVQIAEMGQPNGTDNGNAGLPGGR